MSVFERETVVPMPDVLDPRVVRGAELLDERMPGWFEKISPDTLDLAEPGVCVLGQIGLCVYGEDYWPTAERLLGNDPLEQAAKEHAFWAADDEKGEWDEFDAGRLEQDWRLAILSRRPA